jgi:hypothetical protein
MPHSVTRSAVFTVMEPGSARSTRAGGVTEIRTTTSAAAGGMGDPLRDASRSERHRERVTPAGTPVPSSPFSADVSSILEQSHESPLGPRGPARALGHGGARGAPPTGGTRGAPPNTRAAAGPAAALHARAPVEGASQGAGTLPGARGHSANQLLSVTRSPVGPSERVGGDQGHGPGHPGGRAGRDYI